MVRKVKRKPDSGMKHGEGTIVERPRADGTSSWQLRTVDHLPNGRVKRSAVTYATREAAEDAARIRHRKRLSGAYVAPELRTVADLIAEWLERGRLARNWSENTAYTYTSVTKLHIVPHIGHVRILALTPPQVQHWIDTLVRSGLSPSSVRSAHQIVAGAFREAVRLGVVPMSPTLGVRLPAPRAIKPIQVWMEDEPARIAQALTAEPMWLALYHVALATGMRPGELRALKWTDIDLAKRRVLIQRTASRDLGGNEVVVEHTKTKLTRVNALSARAVDALDAWRIVQAEERRAAPVWHVGEWVFTEADGAHLTKYRWAAEHTRICAKAGVRAITRHQIRTTNATLSLDAGQPLKVVSERLGHTRPEFTARVYQVVSTRLAQEFTDDLSDRLFGRSDSEERQNV